MRSGQRLKSISINARAVDPSVVSGSDPLDAAVGSRPQRGPAELLAGTAGWTDDHVQLARARAARERLRRNAQSLRQTHRDALALRREVDGRLRIRERVGARDLLDAVAESTDAACHLPRAIYVAAAVQHRHLDAPRRRENCD